MVEPQPPVLDDRAQAAAEVERRGPLRAEREDLVGPRGHRGTAGDRLHREPPQCRGKRLDALDRGIEVDQRVEHLGLVAQDLERAQDVGLGRGVDGAERGQQFVAHPVARVDAALVGGVLAPGEAALHAVSGRLLARAAEQRSDHARAVADPEQRAPARRGGEPVEHGLDLVGGRVTGGDDRAEPRRLPVAHLPRPCLDVAARWPGPANLECGAQPFGERRAVRLVHVRLLTEAIVDVQGRHRAGEADGQIEQADRVASARQQHDDRAREQAAGADALLDDAHGALGGATLVAPSPRLGWLMAPSPGTGRWPR